MYFFSWKIHIIHTLNTFNLITVATQILHCVLFLNHPLGERKHN